MYVTRPAGLTAICVIAIVLAGSGFLVQGGGLFWWYFGEQFVESLYGLMGLPEQIIQQQMDLQKPMYDEIGALQQRWAPWTIALSILHVVLVVLLMVAAIRGLKMRKGAGKLLATAMAFAILFELARIYPTIVMQQESNEISMRHTERTMQQQPGGNPAQMRAMISLIKRFQEMVIAVTYMILGSWLLAKLSYYGISLWYVNRKSFKALFEPEDESTGSVSVQPPVVPIDRT